MDVIIQKEENNDTSMDELDADLEQTLKVPKDDEVIGKKNTEQSDQIVNKSEVENIEKEPEEL